MGRIGHQFGLSVEQGAGEIEPLFYVGRKGRSLQLGTHFLGNAHEPPGEQFEL